MTSPIAALSTTARLLVASSILLIVLAALFVHDRTRYRPLDLRLDPQRASESYTLEPDPLVLVTASAFRSAHGRLPPSVIFALWPDGHGYFCDPEPTSRPAHFRFQLNVRETTDLACQILEIVRPVDGQSLDFEDGRSIAATTRAGDSIRSLSTDATFFAPSSIAHHRASNPAWPAADPYATDPVDRATIEAQIALGELLAKFTSTVRASATPITLTARAGSWTDLLR